MRSGDRREELRKITGAGIMMMVVALVVSVFNSGINAGRSVILASEETSEQGFFHEEKENAEALVVKDTDEAEMLRPVFTPNRMKLSENYIVIPKPDKEKRAVTVTDHYVYHTIFLDIEGEHSDFYSADIIKRVAAGNEYTGEPERGNLPPYMEAYIKEKPAVSEEEELAFDEDPGKSQKAETGADPVVHIKKSRILGSMNGTRLALTCNRLYVPQFYEDEENYYILLKKPKEVYDKIIVVDAGHGGRNPGTFSFDGTVLEKDTNLNVALFLKELFDEEKEIKVYYSRLDDSTVYLRARADLANEAEADFFISIHNNAYFNSLPSGTEVFYNEGVKEASLPAGRLSEIMLSKVSGVLNSRSRGNREGSDKYVLGHTYMPSALIEIGFLTNENDLRYITDDAKMRECARAIYDSVLEAYEERK